MHDLLVLRHAEAAPAAPGGGDFERPLSPHGLAQADAAGRWLTAHAPPPDMILCSPAQRTRMTAARILEAMAPAAPSLQILDGIYEATPGQLITLLDRHAVADSVLLIGHNPGLEHLVALLCEGRSPDFRGMPSAALAHIRLDGPLEPGNGRLLAFHTQ
ncbi:MAG TPA: histidine phosphatase family protein [Rhodanobacteraceae bacterium]|nr:histidine phosphatase family protein [Rhodanobacteraceae bacterium]